MAPSFRYLLRSDVMQLDLLIACDLEGNVNDKGRYMGTPALCIEIISKSTRSKDMVTTDDGKAYAAFLFFLIKKKRINSVIMAGRAANKMI